MLIRVNPGSTAPIYRQISDAISAQVADGSLGPGNRLPSARSLAESLGVNMHTVLRAYTHLESEGLVKKRRGRAGVVVSPTAGLAELAQRLVRAARHQGLTRVELTKFVEEAW